MKYRLKSDPSVTCEAIHWMEYPVRYYTLGKNPNMLQVPAEAFEMMWEPVPEPALPLLIEEELDAIAAANGYGSGSTSAICRAAAEIRALRAACVSYQGIPIVFDPPDPLLALPARAGGWPSFEKQLIQERGQCERCGNEKLYELGGHHLLPYYLLPDLELDPANIAVVCFTGPLACHFNDHLGDWRSYDPYARRHNLEFRGRMLARPKLVVSP